MSLNISSEDQSGVKILHIEGRLDATSSPALDEQLSSLISSGTTKLIVDFSKVEYLSSAGMRLMLSNTKKASGQSGKLIFASINDDVMEIIRMAGFEKILSISSSVEDAIHSLQN